MHLIWSQELYLLLVDFQQYNLLVDFRQIRDEHSAKNYFMGLEHDRQISR
jgi:hypothetical protein